MGNKCQWNFNQNTAIVIQKNVFENVVWKMAAILSWPQNVNKMQDKCITMLWDILYMYEDQHLLLLKLEYWGLLGQDHAF